MTILPKVIYRFVAIPIKTLISFFTKIEKEKKKTILIVVWNHKRTETAITILSKNEKLENNIGGIILPDLKIQLHSHSNESNIVSAQK